MTAPNSTVEFLKSFHLKHPSCTPVSFSNGITKDGLNSYEMILAPFAEELKKSLSLLDLACGDGALLELIFKKTNGSGKYFGVDMSEGELAAAKKRLSGKPIELISGVAQALPFSDESLDLVTCHLAFMLMSEADIVVQEIQRTLKPGGAFCAIAGGKRSDDSAVIQNFYALMDAALDQNQKNFLRTLGDSRTRSEEGLKELSSKGSFETSVSDFSIRFYDVPENLINFFMLRYDVAMLDSEKQTAFAAELLKMLRQNSDTDGKVEMSLSLRRLISRKRIRNIGEF